MDRLFKEKEIAVVAEKNEIQEESCRVAKELGGKERDSAKKKSEGGEKLKEMHSFIKKKGGLRGGRTEKGTKKRDWKRKGEPGEEWRGRRKNQRTLAGNAVNISKEFQGGKG